MAEEFEWRVVCVEESGESEATGQLCNNEKGARFWFSVLKELPGTSLQRRPVGAWEVVEDADG